MNDETWRPASNAAAISHRARLLQRLREFFAARGVLEVETPLLCASAATSARIASFEVVDGPDRFYLQSSPEHAMKRLLAHGVGSIYQISRAFRRGETGRLHNPEFTLLEWYRLGYDLEALVGEVLALVDSVLGPERPERWTYRDIVRHHAGIDPLAAPIDALRHRCLDLGFAQQGKPPDRGECLDFIFSAAVEPALRARRVVIASYPPEMAELARLEAGEGGLAARFELFVDGIELANGYDELLDPDELTRRFAADGAAREAMGISPVEADARLIAAQRHGLPACAGVALGVDRLLMLVTGARDIRDVLAFPIDLA